MSLWGNNSLDNIDIQFLNAFVSDANTFVHAGMNLGYFLALMSILISVGMMMLRGEETHAMFSKIIQSGLLFGLMFGLIEYGGQWIPEILNGFIYVGQQASGMQSVSPSSVFDQGWYIAGHIIQGANNAGMFHIVAALTAVISAFFIIIVYGFIAGSLCVLLVKAYALVLVGPLVFALGNLDVTRSTVHNYVQKIIGMGFNLVMFYILVGVGIKLGNHWADVIKNGGFLDLSVFIMIIGGLIVFYLIMQNVPSFIATISGAGGFRDYGQAAVAAAMTGAAVMGQTYMKAMTMGKGGIAGAGMATRAAVSAGKGAAAGWNAGGATPGALSSGIGSAGGAFQSFMNSPAQKSAATPNTGSLLKGYNAAKYGGAVAAKTGAQMAHAATQGVGGMLNNPVGRAATRVMGGLTGAAAGLGKHVTQHGVQPKMQQAADIFKGNKPK
ncbi:MULTISPECIES: type IV secretion system protein [Cysteiniphilum]|uniref:Type IV secretion system protein TrbL n=1 Tax=Cysteiniphilum litorale TaxID=2056700 RepID=A0A8J2Z3P5_9GAMM|nr:MULTISPECIES: type IV secretion system protein [Cysteiniphilum]GGF93750.1 hypothetical protein GCM10010995_08690 [Cysteiniphilum litorale]